MANWREMIAGEMKCENDSWDDVIGMAFQHNPDQHDKYESPALDKMLDREFHAGFGWPEGDYFTVWTEKRVYFPVQYDGAESVGSVPRFPCNEATIHLGG